MPRRPLLLSLGLLLAVGGSVVGATAMGSVEVSWTLAARVLWAQLGGPPVDAPVAARIVWQLRLPRAVLALLVGGGLSVVGVAMQALVRNPLAEPYVLGISSGASAGASLFYLGFLPPLVARHVSMPLAAVGGGWATLLVVYAVAQRGARLSIPRLLLAGVALSALMGAVTSFITFASPEPDKLRAVLFWLLGSLSGTQWTMLTVPAVVTLSGGVVLWALARPLDAFLLGEEAALHLGVPVETLKHVLLALAALITGTLVAVSGAIGFVGLIVPHAVRAVVGVPHRRVLPLSFLGGALFLLWADVAARSLLPGQELPVGILTALCGVPFFLMLLRRGTYHFGIS